VAEIVRLNPGPRMSQGVVHAGVLYVSGHVDATAADVAGQTRNILARIDALLTKAGASRATILSANIWLADMSGFGALNEVWEAWIDRDNPPARATVESKLAGPDYLVEISVIAAIG
jgi:enamine deaminase RidA (YjgF/YER057c/UK114 family)